MNEFPTRDGNIQKGTSLRSGILADPPPPPVPAQVASPASCANCGTELAGAYCSQCGQHVADYHRSLWRFLSDFFDNTFCWDNKFLRTVSPLLQQPGFLTHEFMEGRRVRYVHPLRLFLFTSAVCLALIGFINHHTERSSRQAKALRAAAHARTTTRARPEEETADEAQATAPQPTPVASAAPTTPVFPDPAGPREVSLGEKIQQVLAASAGKTYGPMPVTPPPEVGTSSAAPVAANPAVPGAFNREGRTALRERDAAATPPKAAGGSPGPVASTEPGGDALEAKISRVIERAGVAVESATSDEDRARKIGQMVKMGSGSERAGKMAEALSEGVEQRLSWVGLALLPVFALLLRAVYWREDDYYFAHLVFSLHYHAFLFLFWAAWAAAGIVMSFLPLAGLWNFLLACGLFLPGWYLYAALRRLYGESKRRTVAKVVLLGALHLLTILIGVVSAKAMVFFSA